jgi:hypothetical protein
MPTSTGETVRVKITIGVIASPFGAQRQLVAVVADRVEMADAVHVIDEVRSEVVGEARRGAGATWAVHPAR